MDFDKTSFSVDWFTPGDKYGPKRLSFPKSACISIDDLVSDSPLSFCFTPPDEAIPRPRTHSIVDTPFERACGWPNSAPRSPTIPSPREAYPMYKQAPKNCEEGATDWEGLSSPGLQSIADACASCGVDLDASCLDAVDEQLLLSPVECFIELCWASAVQDDVSAPVMRRSTRSRARSFKADRAGSCLPGVARDYPGSFERTRPLAAKIALPLGPHPRQVSSSPSSDSHDTSVTYQEKPLAYVVYADPGGRLCAAQDTPSSRRWKKKRDWTLTPSVETLARPQPPPATTPRLKTSKSSHTLRVLTDACATFARPGKRSPLVVP